MTENPIVKSCVLFAFLPCSSIVVSAMSDDDVPLLVVISVTLTLSVTLFPVSKWSSLGVASSHVSFN